MLTSFYDVAVLGRSPNCLVTAALLAKQGFRVVLVGQREPDPTFVSGPRRLPRGPSAILPSTAPVLDRTVRELTLALGDEVSLARSAPAARFQLALPGQRLDLWDNPEALEEEFAREFPRAGRIIREFHRTLATAMEALDELTASDVSWPPIGFFDKRRFAAGAKPLLARLEPVYAHLASFSELHPFAVSMRLVTQFMGRCDPKSPSRLGMLRLWHHGLTAPPAASSEALLSQLHRKLQNLGVELRPDQSAERIDVRKGRLESITMENTAESIGVGFVACGVDVHALVQLLPDRRSFDDVFERLGEPQVRYLRYGLVVVVASAALPVGLAQRLFSVQDLAQPLHSENALHIEVRRGPDESLLLIEALLPRGWVEEVEDYLSTVRAKVLAHVRNVLHLPESAIHWVDSPHDHAPPEDGFGKAVAAVQEPWRCGPGQMESMYHFPVTGALELCALPCHTPVDRVLLCNGQMVPGLGLEGELLSTFSATRAIQRSDRDKARMRRGRWTKIDL